MVIIVALKLLWYGVDSGDDDVFEMNKDEQRVFLNLYDNEYCVNIPRGFIARDKVVITDSPLKGLESQIKKINRHKAKG